MNIGMSSYSVPEIENIVSHVHKWFMGAENGFPNTSCLFDNSSHGTPKEFSSVSYIFVRLTRPVYMHFPNLSHVFPVPFSKISSRFHV